MKKLALILLFSLLETSAFAGSANLDLRMDMRSQDFNDAASMGTNAVGADNYKFYLQSGRIDFKGNFNEELSYRLRFRFATKPSNAAGTTVSNRDSTTDSLDLAFVAHKLNENTVLTAGKYASEIGGFEGNTSSGDVYLHSEAYGGTTYLNKTGKSGLSSQLYYTGAKLAYLFGGHEFNLQTANSPADKADANGQFNQDDGWTGAVLKMNFDEKVWGVIASYHVSRPADDKTKREYMALGLQYKMDQWLAQLDYLSNPETVSDTSKFSVNSIIANLRYAMNDNWTPFLKVISSEEKIETATTVKNTYMSYGAGVEYRAKKDDLFRYHLAANSRTMKPDTGDDRSVMEAIAGFRIYADFLK